ncbi:hypothetical protein J4Q44_G00234800 [Coregonus suidteri]|uniref:Uncharacterized protein n=1 Tax=Coregonus suidteri TaxID=861788 RepID=A0AAN8LB79_9TELE
MCFPRGELCVCQIEKRWSLPRSGIARRRQWWGLRRHWRMLGLFEINQEHDFYSLTGLMKDHAAQQTSIDTPAPNWGELLYILKVLILIWTVKKERDRALPLNCEESTKGGGRSLLRKLPQTTVPITISSLEIGRGTLLTLELTAIVAVGILWVVTDFEPEAVEHASNLSLTSPLQRGPASTG